MIERERRELQELLSELEVSSGEMDAATSARLRRRLESVLDADPNPQDRTDVGRIVSFPELAPPPELEEPPPVLPLAEPTPLPLYSTPSPSRRPRALPAALSAAALVAAAVLAVVILPSRSEPDPERRELALPAVLAPVLGATPVPLPSDATVSYTTTTRKVGSEATTRRRDIHPDGTVTETVLDDDGAVLATFPSEASTTPTRFGDFTYDELRSLPTTAAELRDTLRSTDRAATLAQVAALPVTPPAVRAAAVEALTDDGFTWHLDDGGLMVGSRGSQPIEEVAVDPATGRVTAHGWVDDPGASLLDAVQVTIWR